MDLITTIIVGFSSVFYIGIGLPFFKDVYDKIIRPWLKKIYDKMHQAKKHVECQVSQTIKNPKIDAVGAYNRLGKAFKKVDESLKKLSGGLGEQPK